MAGSYRRTAWMTMPRKIRGEPRGSEGRGRSSWLPQRNSAAYRWVSCARNAPRTALRSRRGALTDPREWPPTRLRGPHALPLELTRFARGRARAVPPAQRATNGDVPYAGGAVEHFVRRLEDEGSRLLRQPPRTRHRPDRRPHPLPPALPRPAPAPR